MTSCIFWYFIHTFLYSILPVDKQQHYEYQRGIQQEPSLPFLMSSEREPKFTIFFIHRVTQLNQNESNKTIAN